MFLVYNKEKIISCMIAIGTIFILFAISVYFIPNEEIVETSSMENESYIINNTDQNFNNYKK